MCQINAYEEDMILEVIQNIIWNNQYHTNILNTKLKNRMSNQFIKGKDRVLTLFIYKSRGFKYILQKCLKIYNWGLLINVAIRAGTRL